MGLIGRLLLRVQLNPKPGPHRNTDWEAWVVGFEERYGTAYGPNPWTAIRRLAENIAEKGVA
jgi:hypothetical protein